MSETPADAATDEQATIYTAYEIDFMLSLRPTDNGAITREQIGLRRAPEAAQEFVTAAVTSGLRARGKVERSQDGQWLLGEEGQVIATALTAADRWLGIALAEGEAMRMAFVIKANEAILMLTQDELDSFVVSALPDPSHVPASVSDIVTAFLEEQRGRTVSLRRRDVGDDGEEVPLMFHVEEDGAWKLGHLPLDEDGILSVSDLVREDVTEAVRGLWEDGAATAPSATGA
ncbi:hypothetical protein BH708_17540 [Brachybacterium sp. P6-10-X1]|uniref:hypothetical protein n=1 Tax=Brachybacterium sp. P6-10-X1 TaxID=1903186 RepID=UPI000971BF00|nr:hypothetical protein [Brachybacterium sp. P6-10-X1]APX34208.1 hypothetical protein BH708_17540 [Brachybacterium sp. P6-10-X1]